MVRAKFAKEASDFVKDMKVEYNKSLTVLYGRMTIVLWNMHVMVPGWRILAVLLLIRVANQSIQFNYPHRT